MVRTPIRSTSIAEVGYDPGTHTLEVQFRHGGIYQYFGVPASVYAELMQAASRGNYVAYQIRGRYRYVRV